MAHANTPSSLCIVESEFRFMLQVHEKWAEVLKTVLFTYPITEV
jgi:hypothetical protein